MTYYGLGGDVFGGPHDLGPFTHAFRERPNNGDDERNRLHQQRLQQKSQATVFQETA